MKDITSLLERCRAMGVSLTPIEGRLRVEASHPLPDEIIAQLREAKTQILAVLQRQSPEKMDCWVLEEWRLSAIPAWRRILKESIAAKDKNRESYARWVLAEVLQDSEDIDGGNR